LVHEKQLLRIKQRKHLPAFSRGNQHSTSETDANPKYRKQLLAFSIGKSSKNPVQEAAVKCLEKGNSYQNL
jgi:hypothetical protein